MGLMSSREPLLVKKLEPRLPAARRTAGGADDIGVFRQQLGVRSGVAGIPCGLARGHQRDDRRFALIELFFHSALSGGGRSLGLTCLCTKFPVTGKITGKYRDFGHHFPPLLPRDARPEPISSHSAICTPPHLLLRLKGVALTG